MTSSRSPLWPALIVSVLLHAALLAGGRPAPVPVVKPPHLEARLISTPEKPAREIPAPGFSDLEKNQLAPEEPKPLPPPPPRIENQRPNVAKAAVNKPPAQRKISDYVVYPPEARALRHEGTVHLLVKLDDDGRILEVSVAASSGYAELDDAAVKAALHAGWMERGGRSQQLVPITFQNP